MKQTPYPPTVILNLLLLVVTYPGQTRTLKQLTLLTALLLAPLVLKAGEFYTPEQDKGGMTDAFFKYPVPNICAK